MLLPFMICMLSILFTHPAGVHAHMQLYYPAPFNASNNPHLSGLADPYLLFPHDCCGKTTPYPCHGYLDLLGTPEGASVATWPAGSQQNWSIWGPGPYAGNHWGGSCQVGFSIDNGTTFRVVMSYKGDCPKRYNGWVDPANQTFPFTVPIDLPIGDAVFAWTWNNREQEFFMSCAAVSITPNDAETDSTNDATAKRDSVYDGASMFAARDANSSASANQAVSITAVTVLTTVPACGLAPTSSGQPFTIGLCNCTCADSTDDQNSTSAVNRLKTCLCDCPSDTQAHPSVKRHVLRCDGATNKGEQPLFTFSNGTHICVCTKSHLEIYALHQQILYGGCNCTKDAPPSAQSFDPFTKEDLKLKDKRQDVLARNTIAFNDRPLMFVSNIQALPNGCLAPKTTAELKYPEPGPDVVTGDGVYSLELPAGNCA